MTSPAFTAEDVHTARFVDNEELRRRLAPKMGRDRFWALIQQLEKRGFPPISKVWGLRDYRHVERWLDAQYEHGATAAYVEDGPENFDAHPPKRSRKTGGGAP